MKKLIMLAACIGALAPCEAAGVKHRVLTASSEPQSIIKTIPEDSTLEYRIKGQLVQSITVAPGTYRISVTPLH